MWCVNRERPDAMEKYSSTLHQYAYNIPPTYAPCRVCLACSFLLLCCLVRVDLFYICFRSSPVPERIVPFLSPEMMIYLSSSGKGQKGLTQRVGSPRISAQRSAPTDYTSYGIGPLWRECYISDVTVNKIGS